MKISLITATYNSAATLRDTIESVLAQTYSDIEYIIKDGGSKDDTLVIAREYEPRFAGHMKIISAPDKGIYDAMNVGIQAANGEIVGLLNSDDVLASPDAVAKQMAFFDDTSVDAVYGDVLYVKEDLQTPVRYYSSKDFKPWKMKIGLMPAHPTFYCRKAIYEKYGYFSSKYKVAADFESLLRYIYINRIKCAYNPNLVVKMRTGGASSSGLASRKQIMKDHLQAFKDNGIYNNAFILSLRYPAKIWDLLSAKLIKRYE